MSAMQDIKTTIKRNRMKYTHIFFSLSFLFACSFMANAMDTSDEPAPAQEKPESYHEVIKKTVEILNQNHLPMNQEYSLNPSSPIMGGKVVKKVILRRKDDKGRENGKETDEALASIRNFDWQKGKRSDAHKGSKQAAKFARFLALANATAGVKWQEVDDNGNLVTIFEEEVFFHTIAKIYCQVSGMGEVEMCTERDNI